MKRGIYLFLWLCLAQYSWGFQIPEVGQCIAHPDSKNYTPETTFGAYPREIGFVCSYTCRTETSFTQVTAVTRLTVNGEDHEGRHAVCSGVVVERRRSRGPFEFVAALPFFIYDTNSEELKNWAKEQNIDLNLPTSLELRQDLKAQLYLLGNAYVQTRHGQFEKFHQAGALLFDIASGLPENTEKLDHFIATHHGQPANPLGTPDEMVWSIISSVAHWRL